MIRTVRFGGKEHDRSVLSGVGRENLAQFEYLEARLQEAENMHAVLTKARRAYIADIKNEMIRGKSGVDLSALFSD
jgi:hypothetical protein